MTSQSETLRAFVLSDVTKKFSTATLPYFGRHGFGSGSFMRDASSRIGRESTGYQQTRAETFFPSAFYP
jgi:hypothetical protein